MAYDYIFVGGGLSGGLGALALLEGHEPEPSIAIVEREAQLGGNHTWCFHARDVPAAASSFVTPLVTRSWQGYDVRFPRRMRRLHSPYACVTSERLHALLSQRMNASPNCRLLLSTVARTCEPNRVELGNGEVIEGKVVIDARGPSLSDAEQRGYQKFVGLELEVEPDRTLELPVVMDACVRQSDGFRFLYALPLAGDRVLLEDTFFSDRPELDHAQREAAILAYAKAQGLRVRNVLRKESGVLPMPFHLKAASATPGVILAGYRAGLFHPVTGYSFPLAARFAVALASPEPHAALQKLRRAHDAQLGYLCLLTRLMFTAFAPEQRYRALEHFYRLPADLIERFYAAELTLLDRARIFAGPPPREISLRRALGRREVRA